MSVKTPGIFITQLFSINPDIIPKLLQIMIIS